MSLKQKNFGSISEWLDNYVIGMAEQSEVLALSIELKFLLDQLPEQYREGFYNETEALANWLAKRDFGSIHRSSDAHNIYIHGINQQSFLRNISQRYVIAFLACRADDPKTDAIRSVYFFLSLRMVLLTDYNSRIKTTLNECRYLTNKIRGFLVYFLPDVRQCDDLEQLKQALETAKNNDNFGIVKLIYLF